jgi:hypothetical protein
LNNINNNLEAKLEEKKRSVQLYVREKGEEIMQLNNDVISRKAELEKIIEQ